jgi:uncharacterized protein
MCVSAFLAGIINSIAGGGTLLTFPSLMAVLSPVMANATSTIAVFPGTLASAWAYRRDAGHPPRLLWWLLGPSVLGGLLGTWLVTSTDERIFAALVPWLILAAALLFALQPVVARYTKQAAREAGTMSQRRLLLLAFVQFGVGIYGGYFGAGMGIMMLCALAYMGLRDVHEMNSLKTLLAGAINIAAAALFISEGKVVWRYALPMAFFCAIGGYMGAKIALRVSSAVVRNVVIAIGIFLAVYYFAK